MHTVITVVTVSLTTFLKNTTMCFYDFYLGETMKAGKRYQKTCKQMVYTDTHICSNKDRVLKKKYLNTRFEIFGPNLLSFSSECNAFKIRISNHSEKLWIK